MILKTILRVLCALMIVFWGISFHLAHKHEAWVKVFAWLSVAMMELGLGEAIYIIFAL